jgi:enoyl-CoA hydratase/carnithine racemase
VRLDRAPKRNAPSISLLTELADRVRHAEGDDDARCVVLTGRKVWRRFSSAARRARFTGTMKELA